MYIHVVLKMNCSQAYFLSPIVKFDIMQLMYDLKNTIKNLCLCFVYLFHRHVAVTLFICGRILFSWFYVNWSYWFFWLYI